MFEPTVAPASSSSTVSPRSRRYRATASATGRSSPGGLAIAASSVKRSTTSEDTALTADFQQASGLARPGAVPIRAPEVRVPTGRAEERDHVKTRAHLRHAERERPHAVVVDLHRPEPHPVRKDVAAREVARDAVEPFPCRGGVPV